VVVWVDEHRILPDDVVGHFDPRPSQELFSMAVAGKMKLEFMSTHNRRTGKTIHHCRPGW